LMVTICRVQSGLWSLVTDYWSLITGHWSLITGHWSLVTDYWSLITGHWSLVTDYWSLVSGIRFQVSGFSKQKTDNRRQISCFEFSNSVLLKSSSFSSSSSSSTPFRIMFHKVTFFDYDDSDPIIAARARIWQTARSVRQTDSECAPTR
jgi:phosphoglucomutase/phosphopentomutase